MSRKMKHSNSLPCTSSSASTFSSSSSVDHELPVSFITDAEQSKGCKSNSVPNSVQGFFSAPCSPEDNYEQNDSLGLLSKLRRHLSGKRRKNMSSKRRKSSQESTCSLDAFLRSDDVGRRLSNASRDSLLASENENIYRGILRSLLHPLGAPDTTVGLRPGDLVDHLRNVFEVDRDEHEFFIKEELANKPKCLQTNVTVVEGRNLRPTGGSKELGDPFCIVSIVGPFQKTLKISPKSSPRNSPKMSPRAKKSGQSQSFDNEDILRTQAIKQTSEPQWNEEFQLTVDELLTDEIHIYVCNQDIENSGDNKHGWSHSQQDKHHGIKHLFRLIRQMADHEKVHDGCLGRIVIPVRDIPAQGCDWWWDVMSLSNSGRSSSKAIVGRVRLQLDISHRRDNGHSEESFSIEDYYQATQQVYEYATKKAKEADSVLEKNLAAKDRRLLDNFAVAYKISKLSQAIVHVIVLLEWTTNNDDVIHTRYALHKAIHDLQMTWATQQCNVSEVHQKMPITDAEISMYRKATAKYITCICDNLEDLPSLFPPSVDSINVLKDKLGSTIQLLELDLWDSKCSPQSDLTTKVYKQLQEDIDSWLIEKIESIKKHDLVKDFVIPELTTLGEIINLLSSNSSPIGVVRNFFNSIGINYYRAVSFALEKQVSRVTQELMLEMDKYQRRYHNFAVNITASSRLSLRLYFAVRKFYNITRDNVSRRDAFRLSISQYQSWFQEALVFWVQTFRTECTNRIERALEIDKDVVVATSLVKFSNSSVDVLSCFAKITEEWRQIDFHDADSNLMGVTKITDLICDGARLYGDKIHSILERNGYYDDSLEQFDITERLCITLNNIEHVRQYLTELPQLLDWESVITLISTRYQSDDIGIQANKTLRRLIDTADREIILKSSLLLQQITEKMKIDIARFMEIFTTKLPERASSVDSLIGYLSTNLKTLQDRMMSSIYPRVIRQLWNTVLSLLDKQIKTGERPEYYQQIKQHVRSLTSYFIRGGMEDEKINCIQFNSLKSRLDMNCLTTEELTLDYFGALADNLETPVEYFGHVAVKTAFLEETRGNVTLFVKVIRATDLPGLDASGLSDPYVTVGLYPQTMFGFNRVQRTRVLDQTLNPVFNTTFQFPNIPREYLYNKGAVILLSVLDHDHIGHDDFAGEIVLHISSVQQISMSESVDSKPVVMMPLKRPITPKQGPYKVLVERSTWDRGAKQFITERKKYMDYNQPRTDKPSKFSGFFSFLRGDKT